VPESETNGEKEAEEVLGIWDINLDHARSDKKWSFQPVKRVVGTGARARWGEAKGMKRNAKRRIGGGAQTQGQPEEVQKAQEVQTAKRSEAGNTRVATG